MSDRIKKLLGEIKKEAQWAQLGKPKAGPDTSPGGAAPSPASKSTKNYGGAEGVMGGGQKPSGAPVANKEYGGTEAVMSGGKQPSTTSGAGGGSSVPVIGEVKKMQEAILHFADVASSTDVTSMTGNKEGRMEGDQTRAIPVVEEKNVKPGDLPYDQAQQLHEKTKDDKNYLGGSDPFGNFIVQNYIGKDSYVGKQYLNTDVSGEAARQSAFMNPTNLRGIIDTIKRVGSPNMKGEKTVDGLWQTRTNNSLHVIGDLVDAMLKFTHDLKMKIPGYEDKYLAAYKSFLPGSYTDMKSGEDITARATAIIPHLAAMTKFFEGINEYVFNNQDIRKYIDQKEPFEKYQKPTQIPPEMRAFGIPGLKFDWVKNPSQNWISLHELSSLDNFKKFINRTLGFGVDEKDPEQIKRVLDLVNQAITNQQSTLDLPDQRK